MQSCMKEEERYITYNEKEGRMIWAGDKSPLDS